MSEAPGDVPFRNTLKRVGIFAGPVLAGLVFLLLPERYTDLSGRAAVFTLEGRTTTAIATWMAVWWLTEATHITVTALLPIVLFPILGARPISEAAAPYAHHLIFLFMGGFVIALSMERWGLHKRIALAFLRIVGTGTGAMVGGFMFVTAFLSMWVSNTATSLMMVPIAVSVIDLVARGGGGTGETGRGSNFAVCLMLGIAYSASLGGLSTLIGTPPNAFLASYIEESLGREISFADWMIVALPVSLVFIPAAWVLLCKVVYPLRVKRIEGGGELIRSAYAKLGPMKRGEWVTLAVFAAAAFFWIFRKLLAPIEIGGFRPLAGLSDPGIAMSAALVLFLFPVDLKKGEFAMTWDEMKRLPWGILVLFGGGLSLAKGIQANGVGEFLAAHVAGLRGVPGWVLTLAVVTMVIFLTELTSNLATVSTLVPLLSGLAMGLELDPYVLIVPAAMAASCAFMLPVATPPNAVVFGFGHVSISQMVKAGFWLNLVGIALVTALAYALVVPVLLG